MFRTIILTHVLEYESPLKHYYRLATYNSLDRFSVTVNQDALDTHQQNVSFSDQTPQWDYSVDSQPDQTFKVCDTNDAQLENFFSRPIKTQSYSWGIGGNLFEVFNPWEDFFQNPRVINRISNYKLLRCKLKVRIILNGNGFHYGRILASYLPLHGIDGFTRDREFVSRDMVASSQRPHVFLDPTTSQGGNLTLPFVWWDNALDVTRADWTAMGKVTLRAMQALKHANGATDSVVISVFVWAEDVSLSIPTANVPGALTPQGGGEMMSPQGGDEYGNGAISRPANVISKMAGALSSIPMLKPYSLATQMAADSVSTMASLFGFSRPIEITPVHSYKPVYLGNMANTNVSDTSQKLTLDVKQETTIDPRVMGLAGTDEMSILSIAQRESYVTKFIWGTADPTESLLWTTEVTPVTWDEYDSEIHMPACCFATLPFKRWRGTMKYRFQIVASAYHKGRLKISYDPSYPLTNEYNTNYLHIIDLAKERDFTVSVGWGHEKSIVEHRSPMVDSVPFSETPLGADPLDLANGILSVYVVNELTVPNSTVNNDIGINVFVSVGDDFEVFDPDSSIIQDLTWFNPPNPEALKPQGGEGTHPDADLTQAEDEPIKMAVSENLAQPLQVDHTLRVFYGDPVVSFRQCLKRYNYHSAVTLTDIGNRYFLRIVKGNFPFYRGYAPGGINSTDDPNPSTPYNYSKMTLINYITPAFTCRRGGIRWKYMRTAGNSNETNMMALTRLPDNFVGYSQVETELLPLLTSNPDQRVRQAAQLESHFWDGGIATSVNHNPVLEAELPYYTHYRFSPAKGSNWTTGHAHNQFHALTTSWDASSADTAIIHSFVSTAEDFTLNLFTGAPVAFRVPQNSDPEPTVSAEISLRKQKRERKTLFNV